MGWSFGYGIGAPGFGEKIWIGAGGGSDYCVGFNTLGDVRRPTGGGAGRRFGNAKGAVVASVQKEDGVSCAGTRCAVVCGIPEGKGMEWDEKAEK